MSRIAWYQENRKDVITSHSEGKSFRAGLGGGVKVHLFRNKMAVNLYPKRVSLWATKMHKVF